MALFPSLNIYSQSKHALKADENGLRAFKKPFQKRIEEEKDATIPATATVGQQQQHSVFPDPQSVSRGQQQGTDVPDIHPAGSAVAEASQFDMNVRNSFNVLGKSSFLVTETEIIPLEYTNEKSAINTALGVVPIQGND